MKSKMQWSDAWILLATIYASRNQPAPLRDVISAADYIDHSIPCYEEMAGALNRLGQAGLLQFGEDGLSVTDKARGLYAGITRPRRSACAEEKDLAALIGAASPEPSAMPQQANLDAPFPALTPQAFQEAVEAYLGKP